MINSFAVFSYDELNANAIKYRKNELKRLKYAFLF